MLGSPSICFLTKRLTTTLLTTKQGDNSVCTLRYRLIFHKVVEGALTRDDYFCLQILVCQAQIRLGDRRGEIFIHPDWARHSAGTFLLTKIHI